jgi:hypothetical protein
MYTNFDVIAAHGAELLREAERERLADRVQSSPKSGILSGLLDLLRGSGRQPQAAAPVCSPQPCC